MSKYDIPAILGGPAVRPQGLPKWPLLTPEIKSAFDQILADGGWGKYDAGYCDQLKHLLQETMRAEHVFLTCSGTAGVELALRGCGIKSGDEVALSAYDFKPNFTNITSLGAKAVLLDCDQNAQLQLNSALALWLQNSAALPKAILASHLHGGFVDISELRRVMDGVLIIEDCCQCPGAIIHGDIAGCAGDVAVISFGGSKTLSAGRGGAVLTNRADIAQRIRLYSERGTLVYPLSEMQAAILIPQVEQLAHQRKIRGEFVSHVTPGLLSSSLAPVEVTRSDTEMDYYRWGFWYAGDSLLSREQFIASVRAEGIPLDVGFRSLDLIHARGRFKALDGLIFAHLADSHLVALHHSLMYDRNGSEDFLTAVAKVDKFEAEIRAFFDNQR